MHTAAVHLGDAADPVTGGDAAAERAKARAR